LSKSVQSYAHCYDEGDEMTKFFMSIWRTNTMVFMLKIATQQELQMIVFSLLVITFSLFMW
jgi:hypothetical protein